MSKPFDMELFLAGVLSGSRATQQRHLRQARISKRRFLGAGNDRRLEYGRKSIWLGFWVIT